MNQEGDYQKKSGAVVVLGSPNDDQGRLSTIARERCDRALEEYLAHPDWKIICTGGFGPHFNTTDRPHHHYTKKYLVSKGAPEEDVLEGVMSASTLEDAHLLGPVLERHGIRAAFDCLCFSYDKGSRKPSPALLRMAMAEIEVAPAAAVMVGDRRERDIAAGRLAGTRTVWIHGADDGGPEADATIDSLAELPDLLRR